jgi:hypothetical protein
MLVSSQALAGDETRYVLSEPDDGARVVRVTSHLSAQGTKRTRSEPDPKKTLALEVDGRFIYVERRLPGTGLDASAYRSVRYYERARAELQVENTPTSVRLSDPLRLIVAGCRNEGMELFSPSGPLTSGELELLQVPADSLPILALLPGDSVTVGETWRPAAWVLPVCVGVEAVEKSTVAGKLVSVNGNVARLEFRGEVKGARLGAPTTIKVTASFAFDIVNRLVTQVQWKQTDQAAPGVVSTGLDITAEMTIDRNIVTDRRSRLSDADLKGLPLEPNAATLLMAFDSPTWGLRFFHDRKWHVMANNPQFGLLRRLDKGALVAQLNVQPLPAAPVGKRWTREQFQGEIRRAVGKSFSRFISSEEFEIPSGGDASEQPSVYRVAALGEGQAGPMTWVYYHVAAKDGRQFVLVFTVANEQLEAFGSADAELVGSLSTPAAVQAVSPASATKP